MSVTFGFQLFPVLSLRKLVNTCVQLEQMGFDQVMVPDHVLFPEGVTAPDPWCLLGAAAHATKRIKLGTGVTDPHRIHPALLAQRAATVDHMSNGRFVLGLGAGEAMNLDPFGIPWNRPVARLKESVRIMRHLWDSREPLDLDGQFFKLQKAVLHIRPIQKRLPIVLAALGPVMQKFCGEECDGWFPVPIPIEFYREMFAPIEAAAKAAGRSVPPSAFVTIVLSEDVELVKRIIRKFVMTLVWGSLLPRLGHVSTVSQEVADTHYQTVNPCDPESMRRFEEHGRSIPDEYVLKFAVHGNIREIRRRLGEYVDAGVQYFNVANASPDPTASTVALANDILPYFGKRSPPMFARIGKLLSPILPRDPEEKEAVRQMLE